MTSARRLAIAISYGVCIISLPTSVIGAADRVRFTSGIRVCAAVSFQSTSVGTSTGVFGAGFNFWNDPDFVGSIDLYRAFVTFGDGSTMDVALPRVSPPGNLSGFFGIVSDTLIRSVHLGLADGAPTNTGHFGLDNLTIGAPTDLVPEPSLTALVALAAAGVAACVRRRG